MGSKEIAPSSRDMAFELFDGLNVKPIPSTPTELDVGCSVSWQEAGTVALFVFARAGSLVLVVDMLRERS